MENNVNLANAAIVGENPEGNFIIDGKRLHAVDAKVASLQKNKSNPKEIQTLMKDALKALIQFANNKVPPHFIEKANEILSSKTENQAEIANQIEQIFTHLHHNDRNALSSMIHHKQPAR